MKVELCSSAQMKIVGIGWNYDSSFVIDDVQSYGGLFYEFFAFAVAGANAAPF